MTSENNQTKEMTAQLKEIQTNQGLEAVLVKLINRYEDLLFEYKKLLEQPVLKKSIVARGCYTHRYLTVALEKWITFMSKLGISVQRKNDEATYIPAMIDWDISVFNKNENKNIKDNYSVFIPAGEVVEHIELMAIDNKTDNVQMRFAIWQSNKWVSARLRLFGSIFYGEAKKRTDSLNECFTTAGFSNYEQFIDDSDCMYSFYTLFDALCRGADITDYQVYETSTKYAVEI